jgi:hypothetical protein
VVNEVKQVLGIERAGFDERYLWLPVPAGRNKRGRFQSMEERYVKRMMDWRMMDWRERTLSQVTKEVLIKAVAQALPTYSRDECLQGQMCETLHKHTRAFWWGFGGKKEDSMDTVGSVDQTQELWGGLSFKDFRLFNQTMLANQAICLIMYPNSLCAGVL